MKYFFISDVHGEYDKMILALAEEGFDMDKDTLVSLGDPFDRGPKSKEVLEFIMACPHHIIVIGNHDWRLMHLLHKPVYFDQYDIANGVPATYKSFLGIPQEQGKMAWEAFEELSGYELLHQYFEEAVLYVEFKDFVAVHAWIPYNNYRKINLEPYRNPFTGETDWRKATRADWYDATWAHTQNCINNGLFITKKRLVIGHWHAWRLAEAAGEKREDKDPKKAMYYKNGHYTYINCDIYYDDRIIALDGCSNWPNGGKVNVLTYETDEEPQTLLLKDCR